MRRIAATLVLVLAGAVTLAAPSAGAPDTTGPPCADIIAGDLVYNKETKTVSGPVDLAAPACRFATYTLDVYADAGLTQLLGTQTISGSTVTGSQLSFNVTWTTADQPQFVFIVGTSTIGRHNADTTPGVPVESGSSGGNQGFG